MSLSFIRELFNQIISRVNPEIVAIDGLGADVQYKSTYYTKRLKVFGSRKPKNPWHKLDIIVNVKSKEK